MTEIKLQRGVFKYDAAKPLGRRGGFGQVFAGVNDKGEEVAVKKLHVSAAAVNHRELRIAEEFWGKTFQYVIPFIDSGEDADSGAYFVIMQKAERSLQAVIEAEGLRNASDAAVILQQIVLGLIEVEDIVHRDMKPDNVLLHEAKWKVADFGIARFAEEATSTNTLKECLSPYYAAPEQWRKERCTHATDVYALGCIAFFLLTGRPPFTKNPPEEHQQAPVPSFQCTDPRLSSLVNLMLRKNPSTRPALDRVRDLLNEIVQRPQQNRASGAPSALAHAGAEVARWEQERQATLATAMAVQKARLELAAGAAEILAENMERLWKKIQNDAPAANRNAIHQGAGFELGYGHLIINGLEQRDISEGFRSCGWDVIWAGRATVIQRSPHEYIWSSSLWYAKPQNASDYRWYEISFWDMRHGCYQPFACSNVADADYALSPIMHVIQIAFGPKVIDDDKEDEFHDRWIWLLAQASVGKLSQPSSLPIQGWPPQLLR